MTMPTRCPDCNGGVIKDTVAGTHNGEDVHLVTFEHDRTCPWLRANVDEEYWS
jgi:hypothetical protein